MSGSLAPQLRWGLVAVAVSAVFNGLWPSTARAAYADGANVIVPLLFMSFARTVGLVAFCYVTRRRLFATRHDLRQGVIGGFFQAIANGGFAAALVYLPGPVVMIVAFTHSLMLLFFMAWRREIKLTLATVIATVMALAGLTLVLDLWHTQSTGSLIGMALAFAGAVATVIRLYVFGRQMNSSHPFVVGAETFVFTTIFLLPGLFLQSPHFPLSWHGWMWIAAMSVTMTIGIFAMFYGIAMLGAFRWSLFAKVEPIFTALFAFLLLGETLKSYQYLGMAIVLASLAAYQIMDNRAKMRAIVAEDIVPS